MSYIPKENEDSLSDLFSRLSDFTITVPHLLEAKTEESFRVWFEKLIQIDKRSLFLYLRKNKDKFPPEFIAIANTYYVKDI